MIRNFKIGQKIVCVNNDYDKKCKYGFGKNLTLYKTYEIKDIDYDYITFKIIDDSGDIKGYKINRFISLFEFRKMKLLTFLK